jgi:hypothetical protein
MLQSTLAALSGVVLELELTHVLDLISGLPIIFARLVPKTALLSVKVSEITVVRVQTSGLSDSSQRHYSRDLKSDCGGRNDTTRGHQNTSSTQQFLYSSQETRQSTPHCLWRVDFV